MELSYIQNCPACGAPVELEETDRIVDCPYCDSRNFMIQDRPLRFVLPHIAPAEIDECDIFYIPYLRFKGHVFTCQGKKVNHKIIDTTHIGFTSKKIPSSLGLRPQAMKIKLINSEHSGRFVKLTEEIKKIFSKAVNLTELLSKKTSRLYHRAFIGETISYVYLPTYFVDGRLMDGVLNRQLETIYDQASLEKRSVLLKKEWIPHFISTRCPYCADSLAGEKDSLVLQCSNCESLWFEEKGRFTKIQWQSLPGKRESYYLPFWKMDTENTGLDLRNFADLLRITNHPVVIRPEYNEVKMFFWVPAFKIAPQHLLLLAKKITLSQQLLPDGKGEINDFLHPVTLPLDEARQAIKSVLSEAVLNKKKFLPQLPSIGFRIKNAELIYLPFDKVGYDFVQEHTSIAVNKASLSFGRSM